MSNELGTKNIYPAFIKAQAAFQNARKDSENPAFKSKYADLASVVDAVRKPLGDNGLGYFQFLTSTATGICVTTRLIHVSGEEIETPLEMPVQAKTAHALGTAASYLKRYALSSLLGVAAADDDDDGNAASGVQLRHQEVFAQRPPKPEPIDPLLVVQSFEKLGVTPAQVAVKLGHAPTHISESEAAMLKLWYAEVVRSKKEAKPESDPEEAARVAAQKQAEEHFAKLQAENDAAMKKEPTTQQVFESFVTRIRAATSTNALALIGAEFGAAKFTNGDLKALQRVYTDRMLVIGDTENQAKKPKKMSIEDVP